MRGSLQYDPKKAKHQSSLFLEKGELDDVIYIRISGTLRDGMTLKPTTPDHREDADVRKVTVADWGRVLRVPVRSIGEQPPGRTIGAESIPCTKEEDGTVIVQPHKFVNIHPPEKLRRGTRKPEREHQGIAKVTAFRTPDGELHDTHEKAIDHLAHIERLKVFDSFIGITIRKFTVDDKYNNNCIMVLADGRVLSFLTTEHGLSIAVNGEEL
jgi:hypothetical protein